jgi:hypothetical protein
MVLLIGEGLRLWAIGYLEKDQVLTTNGVYRYCRHPCYLGNIIGVTGTVVMSRSLAVTIILAGYVLLTYPPAIKLEEERLVELFGESYLAYRAAVPGLLPRFWWKRWKPTATQSYRLVHLVSYRETHVLVGLFLLGVGLALKMHSGVQMGWAVRRMVSEWRRWRAVDVVW